LRINNDVLAIHLRVWLSPAGEINFSPLPIRAHTSSVCVRIKEARILITGNIKPNKKYKCHGRERLSSKLETKRIDAERQSERKRREARYEPDRRHVRKSIREGYQSARGDEGEGGKAKNERCSTCLPFA